MTLACIHVNIHMYMRAINLLWVFIVIHHVLEEVVINCK